MEMKKRIVLSLSIMIGMTIILILCLQVVRAASPSQPECPSCNSFGVQRYQEKKEAPAFSLKEMDGKQVSLRDFRGKPVLIVFWATWWPSCREELLALEKFSQGKSDTLAFLFITIDGERKLLKKSSIKTRSHVLFSYSWKKRRWTNME